MLPIRLPHDREQCQRPAAAVRPAVWQGRPSTYTSCCEFRLQCFSIENSSEKRPFNRYLQYTSAFGVSRNVPDRLLAFAGLLHCSPRPAIRAQVPPVRAANLRAVSHSDAGPEIPHGLLRLRRLPAAARQYRSRKRQKTRCERFPFISTLFVLCFYTLLLLLYYTRLLHMFASLFRGDLAVWGATRLARTAYHTARRISSGCLPRAAPPVPRR